MCTRLWDSSGESERLVAKREAARAARKPFRPAAASTSRRMSSCDVSGCGLRLRQSAESMTTTASGNGRIRARSTAVCSGDVTKSPSNSTTSTLSRPVQWRRSAPSDRPPVARSIVTSTKVGHCPRILMSHSAAAAKCEKIGVERNRPAVANTRALCRSMGSRSCQLEASAYVPAATRTSSPRRNARRNPTSGYPRNSRSRRLMRKSGSVCISPS